MQCVVRLCRTEARRWFERLLAELQFELWIGDAAQISKQRVRKQKTDRQDAQLLLRLLLEDRFPRKEVKRDLKEKPTGRLLGACSG